MDAFVKDEMTQEISVLEYIKQKDTFTRLRMGTWAPTLDLSISQHIVAITRVVGVPQFQNKRSEEKLRR